MIGTTEIKNYLMSMKREGEIREPLNKGKNAQNLHKDFLIVSEHVFLEHWTNKI